MTHIETNLRVLSDEQLIHVFEKEDSSLDDIRLEGEMDYRSFVGSPYTILKAGKSLVLRKAEGKYFLYNFKENLSAK